MVMATDEATDEKYELAMSAGTVLLASELGALEKNALRRQKKQRVELYKFLTLREAQPDRVKELVVPADARILIGNSWTREDAVNFVIDLAFVDPFAPYELVFRENDFKSALESVAADIGIDSETVGRIFSAKRSALKAHWRFNWAYLFVASLLRTVAIGLGVFFAAPIIGTFLSSGLGFTGISMANHGLAMLHWGAIDPMTAGLMGGRLFATGVGNLSKTISGGNASFLYKVGSRIARFELGKLQVNFREVLLADPAKFRAAEETIASLKKDRDETTEKLGEERELNERGSDRVKDIEQTVKAIKSAIRWMERELVRATSVKGNGR